VTAKEKIPLMTRPFNFLHVLCMREASIRNPASFVSGTTGTEQIQIKFGIWGILVKTEKLPLNLILVLINII
jgi:hypothetical protein